MHNNTQSSSPRVLPMQLEDFGQLQNRYQSLCLAKRAEAVLGDAEPALRAAEDILKTLSTNQNTEQAFVNIRKNIILAGKMRPSEARNMLMDPTSDFIDSTRHKLAAWRKTMERLSHGEGIVMENGREHIPGNAPLALAIAGTACVSNFLSIIQLVLAELLKIDSKNASCYTPITTEIRRYATVLSDCEIASGITTVIN